MAFVCTACETTFSYKHHLKKHLESNKHKNRIESLKQFTCTCGKSYVHNTSLYKHKRTCDYENKVKHDDIKNELETLKNTMLKERERYLLENEKYKKERREMRAQIASLLDKHSGNITHNNTNQHIETQNNNNITININAFGKENTDYLDERTIVSCIDRIYKSVPAILEKIHFDPEHPENHNIKITNKKLSYASVMGDNQKWKMVDRKDAIESMVFNGYNLLDEKYPETKQYVSESKQTHFENFQERFMNQDKDLHKQLKTEVDLLVLNS